jgi:hypothetical protein
MRVIALGDSPDALSPSNAGNASRKSPVDRPRRYRTGRSSETFCERRSELLPLPLDDALVVDARRLNGHRARADRHLPGLASSVADHGRSAILAPHAAEALDVGRNLGLQRHLDHSARSLAGQLVQRRTKSLAPTLILRYLRHRRAFPAPARAAVGVCYPEGTPLFQFTPIHTFWSYLER